MSEGLHIESTDTKFMVRLIEWLNRADVAPDSTTITATSRDHIPDDSKMAEVIVWRSIETDPPDGNRDVLVRSMSGCWKMRRLANSWMTPGVGHDGSTLLWWCEIPRGPR